MVASTKLVPSATLSPGKSRLCSYLKKIYTIEEALARSSGERKEVAETYEALYVVFDMSSGQGFK